VRILRITGAWLAALLMLVWRLTCRYRVENDPRPALRERGKAYAYALLHAHQLAAVFVNDERAMAAMVSRSADGDLLVPALRLRRVRAVRGSSRRRGVDKGGRRALAELARLCAERVPVLLAVDGPVGPRNCVHRGAVDLALDCGAVVLPTLVLPNRRWLLSRTWDRFQIPCPFSTVRLIFGTPIEPAAGADPEHVREAIRRELSALEAKHDPAEHELAMKDHEKPHSTKRAKDAVGNPAGRPG
jgi:lysophospholipid acyltransferase (LPLAT)-like uncharacterized protein